MVLGPWSFLSSCQRPASSFSCPWSSCVLSCYYSPRTSSSAAASSVFSSVAQPCPTLCAPWTTAHQAFLSITNSQSLLKLMSLELVMPSSHLILCRPLLLLPSLFPSIRVFSNELALSIRQSKPGISSAQRHLNKALWARETTSMTEKVTDETHSQPLPPKSSCCQTFLIQLKTQISKTTGGQFLHKNSVLPSILALRWIW